MAEYAKLISEYQWPWSVFMHSLNSEYPFLRVSDVLHFALWNIFRSCWFFIFMRRKLNYICIKLICHFLYFFSVLSRSTKDVFSFWKLAKKGEAWAKTNASRKLVQPCHKSFQRAVQQKHGLATQVCCTLYLYWCCICAHTNQYPCLQHMKFLMIYTANE